MNYNFYKLSQTLIFYYNCDYTFLFAYICRDIKHKNMKRIIMMIVGLMVSGNLYSQVKFDNLILENQQVIYDRVFVIDSLSSVDIGRLLTLNIPKIKNLKNFKKDGDIITAAIEGAIIDYRKCGYTIWNAPTFLAHPFWANVSVLWKDGRYRVTVSNITFKISTGMTSTIEATATTLFSKKRGQIMKDDSDALYKAGRCVDSYLSDLFLFKKSSDW